MNRKVLIRIILLIIFFIGILLVKINVISKIVDNKNNSIDETSDILIPTEPNNIGYINCGDIDKNYDTELEVYQFLKRIRIQHIWIVLAQSKIESANYTSKVFHLNNNLFGMKKSYQRPTVSEQPEDNQHVKGYSYYTNIEFSIIDYVIWQTSYARNLSEKEYLDKLQLTYAEAKDYDKIVYKLSEQLKIKYGNQ